MTSKGFAWRMIVATMTVALLGRWGVSAGGKDQSDQVGILPETVAGYVHDVIEADRTFYTIHVVARMQVKGIVVASENWEERGTLPLPAQFLMESARSVAEKRGGIRYRLISLWPIKTGNGPATEFERIGLEEVRKNPDRPYTGIVTRDTGRFFQAVYADRAIAQACIGCHNSHPNSPRRDFKRNDVMGGIVITIPLGQSPGGSGRD
jgi:Protein of unknown function (DUF3365)